MRLYELYKLSKINEHDNYLDTNKLYCHTQDLKSTTLPYDMVFCNAKFRKSIITEKDREQLLPLIVNNTITLTNKKLTSSYKQSVMSVTNISKIHTFITKLPQCNSLNEINDLQQTMTSISMDSLTSKQLVEILDSLIVQMHRLNVAKFNIPLRILSLRKDVNKVWYENADDSYDFLGEILQKFSTCRRNSIYDNIAKFRSKKEYGSFTVYIKEELACLYSMIKVFG